MEAVSTGGAVAGGGNGIMADAWLKIAELTKTVGFPIFVCMAVLWFMRETIMWERDKFLPALTETASALDKTAAVLERVEKKLEHNP
jgi:hypothetical protein